jgi:hypothetical protein
MAAYERNDARGAARLLAIIACNSIADPTTATKRRVALNNVYRLLEAYRDNVFFGMEPPPVPHSDHTVGALSLFPSPQRHVDDVRAAMEASRQEVFADASKQTAIDKIESVLKILIKSGQQNTEPTDRDRAAQFFQSMAKRLELT